jgi:sec-independent protein translocase protein TatA
MNILATLGNLGGIDGLFVLLIVLLLFGSKKLPELARGLGSAVREFSKAKDEIEHELSRPPTPGPRIEQPLETQPQVMAAQTPVGVTAPVTPTPAPATVPAAPPVAFHQEAQTHVPEAPQSAPPA